jgi:hypothetical protein
MNSQTLILRVEKEKTQRLGVTENTEKISLCASVLKINILKKEKNESRNLVRRDVPFLLYRQT